MTRQDNEVYRRQLAVLIFFATIVFKVVMLPKYLSLDAPRDYIVGIVVGMLIEMMLFGATLYVIKYTNIPYMHANIWIKRLLLIFVIVSSSIKVAVMSAETLDYISTLLFQEGRWLFIILTLFPALGYIAYKGIGTIVRMSEIIVWAVVATLIFTVLFLDADMHFDNLFPLFDSSIKGTADSMMRHSLWFGDFVPFLLLSVKEDKARMDKYAPKIGITLTYLVTVGFYLLFAMIYGNVAPYIKYAFSNIAIYNSISNLLGGVDFPIISVWILMAIVKLSFLLYSIMYGVERLFVEHDSPRFRGYTISIITIIYMLILSFAVSNEEEMYVFATSNIRYVVMAIDYTLIIVMLLYTVIERKRKNKTIE